MTRRLGSTQLGSNPAGFELAITRERARLGARPFRSDEFITTGGDSIVVRRFRPA
jgi:hypothetical protein